jgi:hemolysin activation/secretion protein
MKTNFLMPALLVMGMSAAPLFSADALAQQTERQEIQTQTMQSQQEEEAIQIDPMQLPQPVKDSIQNNSEIATLDISEAWQVVKDDGTPYFKVKFDNGGEEMVKKFDADGKEIDKDDKYRKDDGQE